MVQNKGGKTCVYKSIQSSVLNILYKSKAWYQCLFTE